MTLELDLLLPHAGAMRMITAVRQWDASGIVCESTTHRDPANPLRIGGVLPAACGLEYGAQAMAAHGALLAGRQQKPRVGYLAAAHELALYCDRLDDADGPLQIRASCLLSGANHVAYEFCIRAASKAVLLEGRASVVLSA